MGINVSMCVSYIGWCAWEMVYMLYKYMFKLCVLSSLYVA